VSFWPEKAQIERPLISIDLPLPVVSPAIAGAAAIITADATMPSLIRVRM